MKVACVFDLSEDANDNSPATENFNLHQKVFHEVEKACKVHGDVTLLPVPIQSILFEDSDALGIFYNSHLAVTDLSDKIQQRALLYHLGIRKNLSMHDNIVLFHDNNAQDTEALKNTLGSNCCCLPYILDENGAVIVVDGENLLVNENEKLKNQLCSKIKSLFCKLSHILKEVETTSRAHLKEKFLDDLRLQREQYRGDELKERMKNMRRRLDDPELLSADIVLNMLLSYRKIQDYDEMVSLIEDIQALNGGQQIVGSIGIQYHYSFALNRRNRKGDRDKALKVIKLALENSDQLVPNMVGLVGRIYKDKFMESNCEDQDSLENAIQEYRRGFELQPNEYLGIDLATLLVISGKELDTCPELQRIALILNKSIGRKGCLTKMTDYWDVATFFEISVLAEDYPKAVKAAESMFRLNPPSWYLKSTIGNIRLISGFQKPPREDQEVDRSRQLFHFWLDYFEEISDDSPQVADGSKRQFSTSSNQQPDQPSVVPEEIVVIAEEWPAGCCSGKNAQRVVFLVLINEPDNADLIPAYIQLNTQSDPKAVHLWYHCPSEDHANKPTEWDFPEDTIKGPSLCIALHQLISLAKQDLRAVYFYVCLNAEDFRLFFPSNRIRMEFYHNVKNMLSFQEDANLLADEEDIDETIKVEQDLVF